MRSFSIWAGLVVAALAAFAAVPAEAAQLVLTPDGLAGLAVPVLAGPTIAKRIALAINGQNDNVLQGSPFEFLPYNARVEIGMVADVNLVLATVTSGSDVLQEEGPVQKGTADTAPKYPDDFLLEDVAAAGERLAIKLRNTNAAAAVVYVVARITEMGE